MKILIRRTGALGDVLDTTAIAARLKKENPSAHIDVMTAHTSAYFGNPHVHTVMSLTPRDVKVCEYDKFYDFDGVPEKTLRRTHWVEDLSEMVFGDRNTIKCVVLAHDPEPPEWLKADWSRVVALHPARSWPGRTLPQEWWFKLARALTDEGFQPLAIGTGQDWPLTGGPGIDARGLLTLAEQASVIRNAKCFVASDTGMVDVGYATTTPIVWLGTMSQAWLATRARPNQDGKWVDGYKFYPIMADVPCVGCLHTYDEPITYADCKWVGTDQENICTKKFDVEEVVETVKGATQ
jgi:ADP-heptose:LPS heptosyltransferase